MSDTKRTPGEELSDLFYGLQITTKIIEGLLTEYDQGLREQADYESRFHSQINLLASNLKNIKPLTEKLILVGYNKYARSERPDSSENILTQGSDGLATGTQVSSTES
jgi:hypothetical protein